MNKKQIRDIILIVNDGFQLLVSILLVLAGIGGILWVIWESCTLIGAGGWAAVGFAIILPLLIAFVAVVLIPSILLGFASTTPVILGIVRLKAKKESVKQKLLIFNIIGLLISSVLTFAGSFGVEYVIRHYISSDPVKLNSALNAANGFIRTVPIIMLIFNALLLIFTVYAEIPTLTEDNEEWKDN